VEQAAAEPVATVAARAPGAALGLIAGDRAIADGQSPSQDVGDPAAQTVGAVAAGGSLAADGLVVRDRAVADPGRVVAADQEPAAGAGAHEEAGRVARPADGLVVGQGQPAGGQGAPRRDAHIDRAAATHADVEDAVAAPIAAASQGLVVVEAAVRDRL